MTALVSIWPWDDNAIAQAIALLSWWQEHPKEPLTWWLAPLRGVEPDSQGEAGPCHGNAQVA